MARPVGTKNADHEAKRLAIARAIGRTLVADPAGRPSLRDLAGGAGVGVNTLLHYFGDRSGAVAAGLAAMEELGRPYVALLVARSDQPPTVVLPSFLHELVEAWGHGLSAPHTAGLTEGIADPTIGPAYVTGVLEPTLGAVEALLTAWIARGAFPPADVRAAALTLVSPVLLALLHQQDLGGTGCRPLDVHALVDDHVARFLRGWGRAD
ncbi:MAG: TetR/AcrR family transcriptional regulator [Myxococcota bacterium]